MKQAQLQSKGVIVIEVEKRKTRSLYKWVSRVTGLDACWIEGIREERPIWGFIKRVAENLLVVSSRRLMAGTMLGIVLLTTPGALTAQTRSVSAGDFDGKRHGFKVEASIANSHLGSGVTTGDINGDGINDIIIGANAVNSSIGQAYVIFGGKNQEQSDILPSSLDGENGFTINGNAINDNLGHSVSAGDVNGDNIDDVLVTAFGVGHPNYGATYVIFGKTSNFSSLIEVSDLSGSNGFVVSGKGVEAPSFGAPIDDATTGDIDGDGIDDILLGVPSAEVDGTRFGKAFVVFGQTTFTDTVLVSSLSGSSGFSIIGEDANDFFGSIVSSGDINGDGYDDIMISAISADEYNGDYGGGIVYTMFGTSTVIPDTLDASDLSGTVGFSIHRADDYDYIGQSLDMADINGDGYDDMLLGEYHYTAYDQNSIMGYVVFGKSTSFSDSLNVGDLSGSDGFALNFAISNDYELGAMRGGDVNGDGFDDIVISFDEQNSYQGVAYTLFGKSSSFSASIDLTNLAASEGFSILGTTSNSYFGDRTSVGDINGDGEDDILISARSTKVGELSSAGTVHIFTNTNTNSITGDEGFRMLASPSSGTVFDELLDPFFTQGFADSDTNSVAIDDNVWTWNQDSQAWVSLSDQDADTLDAGQGFLMYVFNYDGDGISGFPKTISAPGSFFDTDNDAIIYNNGTINTVTDLADTEFFLTANPFGQDIDWDDADITKTNLSNTIYVYSDTASAYLSWNGSVGNFTDGEVAPFQAFFVEGSGGSGALSIPEGAITDSSATFFKQQPNQLPRILKIHAEAGDIQTDAWLSFQEGGELNKDRYDGRALTPFNAEFLRLATIIGNDVFQINALPIDNQEELTFPLELSGTLDEAIAELRFEGLEDFEGWDIRIKDKETGVEYPIEKEGTIKLEVEKLQSKEVTRPILPTPVPVKRKASSARYEMILQPGAIVNTETGPGIANQVSLEQNYPNPFNPVTTINYILPIQSSVRLEVFDIIGRQVATLVDKSQEAGQYTVNFDSRQLSGLSSGVYMYRLQVGNKVLIKKMTLIK